MRLSLLRFAISESFRQIAANAPKYSAIALLCALLTCLPLSYTIKSGSALALANSAYEAENAADVLLLSTAGFTNEQISLVQSHQGIAAVTPVSYESETALALLPGDVALVSGRLPEAAHECAVSSPGEAGGVIAVYENGILNELTITGVIEPPAAYANSGATAFVPTLRFVKATAGDGEAVCDSLAVTLAKDGLDSRFSSEYERLLSSGKASLYDLLSASMSSRLEAAFKKLDAFISEARGDLQGAQSNQAAFVGELSDYEAALAEREAEYDGINGELNDAAALAAEKAGLLNSAEESHSALLAEYEAYQSQGIAENERKWTEFRNRRNKYNQAADQFRETNPGKTLPEELQAEKKAIDELQQSCMASDRVYDNKIAGYLTEIETSGNALEAYKQNSLNADSKKAELELALAAAGYNLELAQASIRGVQKLISAEADSIQDAESRLSLADEHGRLLSGASWQAAGLTESREYAITIKVARGAFSDAAALAFFISLSLIAACLLTGSALKLMADDELSRAELGAGCGNLRFALAGFISGAVGAAAGCLLALWIAPGDAAFAEALSYNSAPAWAFILAAPVLSCAMCFAGAALARRSFLFTLIPSVAIPAFLRPQRTILEKRALASSRRDALVIVSLFAAAFSSTGMGVMTAFLIKAEPVSAALTALCAVVTLISCPAAFAGTKAQLIKKEARALAVTGISPAAAARLLSAGIVAPTAAAAIFSAALSLAICVAAKGSAPALAWPLALIPPFALVVIIKAFCLNAAKRAL